VITRRTGSKVIFLLVAGHFEEFDNEEDQPSPFLPQDDRIWRHPSEIFKNNTDERIISQNAWLAKEPSKASAWTAGIVGAVLATGLVLLGTRLATVFTARPPANHTVAIDKKVTSSPILGASTYENSIVANQQKEMSFAPSIENEIASVAQSMVIVQASFGTRQVYLDGIVVSSNGLIVTPASSVIGASSIIVETPQKAFYVGAVIGTDTDVLPYNSDLAVIKIQASGLTTAPLDTQEPITTNQLVLALNINSGQENVLGTTIRSLNTQEGQQWRNLIDSMTINSPTSTLIPGTVVLDDSGGIVALVVGNSKSYSVAIPTSLIKPVMTDIIYHKGLLRGWLGIEATDYTNRNTDSTSYGEQGVFISSVYKNSAAAKYGLKAGEIILSVDHQNTYTVNSLMGLLYTKTPGTKIQLLLLYKNQLIKKVVKLASSPN